MGLDFKIVIPSRYAASRLPGKPLRDIAGRTMIARVWDRAMLSGASEVIVATDDQRIVDEVEACGGRVVMTSPDHASGTDRLAEVAAICKWSDNTIVVNLQGDEPSIPVALLQDVASALDSNASAGIATMATPIQEPSELFSENAVKVVTNEQDMALYFSRAPIPWVRGLFSAAEQSQVLPSDTTFLRHIGMYAYQAGVLRQIAAHAQSQTERAESLEQLRAMAMGIGIHVTTIAEAPLPGVDTEEDLLRVQAEYATT